MYHLSAKGDKQLLLSNQTLYKKTMTLGPFSRIYTQAGMINLFLISIHLANFVFDSFGMFTVLQNVV